MSGFFSIHEILKNLGLSMKKWMLCFLVLVTIVLQAEPPAASVFRELKPRQPNWRVEVLSLHPQGTPHQVYFLEPAFGGGERPVKQVSFFESGQIQSEVDVMVMKGPSEENFKVLPHGTRIDLEIDGSLSQVWHYEEGVLHGVNKAFYPSGKIRAEKTFVQGVLEGPVKFYYENGSLKEEGVYLQGRLHGDFSQYYENGHQLAHASYDHGELQGVVKEWYPSGVVKTERRFLDHRLHGDGKNPALVAYYEDGNVAEVGDFREDSPVGVHVRYHRNGKEEYRVHFKEGKKDGKEQFFSEEGKRLGEGLWDLGIAKGKHYRHFASGKVAYLAEFDRNGNLKEPIVEYDEKGTLLKKFSLKDAKLDGSYSEWYENGSPRFEYNYVLGRLEGIQKEYYSSGQIKAISGFKDEKRDGLHEEWHENGILSRRVSFANGLKDGQLGEWYANGTPKMDAYFQKDIPEGVQTEWHENGQLKTRVDYLSQCKHGWWREWNQRGELLSEVNYVQDRVQGTALSWWRGDQIKTRFHFKDGKQNGRQEWFYENGVLQRLANYADDVLDGEQWSYYPDGVFQSLVSYKKGVMDGSKKIWDQKGSLLEEATYVAGKLEGKYFQKSSDLSETIYHFHESLKEGPYVVFYPPNEKGDKIKALDAFFHHDQLDGMVTEYGQDGVRISETPYIQGRKEGLGKLYFPNGKLSVLVPFENDQKNGILVQYFPNGQIWRETEFVHDVREGEERTYYDNGSLASCCFYSKDLLEGLSQSWNPEGVLVFEAEYKDNMRHGIFKKYYDNGKPLLEQTFAYDEAYGEKRKFDVAGNMTVTSVSRK